METLDFNHGPDYTFVDLPDSPDDSMDLLLNEQPDGIDPMSVLEGVDDDSSEEKLAALEEEQRQCQMVLDDPEAPAEEKKVAAGMLEKLSLQQKLVGFSIQEQMELTVIIGAEEKARQCFQEVSRLGREVKKAKKEGAGNLADLENELGFAKQEWAEAKAAVQDPFGLLEDATQERDEALSQLDADWEAKKSKHHPKSRKHRKLVEALARERQEVEDCFAEIEESVSGSPKVRDLIDGHGLDKKAGAELAMSVLEGEFAEGGEEKSLLQRIRDNKVLTRGVGAAMLPVMASVAGASAIKQFSDLNQGPQLADANLDSVNDLPGERLVESFDAQAGKIVEKTRGAFEKVCQVGKKWGGAIYDEFFKEGVAYAGDNVEVDATAIDSTAEIASYESALQKMGDVSEGFSKKLKWYSISKRHQIATDDQAKEGMQALGEVADLLGCGERVDKALQGDDSAIAGILAQKVSSSWKRVLAYQENSKAPLVKGVYGDRVRLEMTVLQHLTGAKVSGAFGENSVEALQSYLTDKVTELKSKQVPEPEPAESEVEGENSALQLVEPDYLVQDDGVTQKARAIMQGIERIDLPTGVVNYLDASEAFVKQIEGASLVELAKSWGGSSVIERGNFEEGSLEAQKGEVLRELAENQTNSKNAEYIRVLKMVEDTKRAVLVKKVNQALENWENMPAKSAERAALSQLIYDLATSIGLTQLSLPQSVWDINDQSGDSHQVIRFDSQVEAAYVNYQLQPLQQKISQLKGKIDREALSERGDVDLIDEWEAEVRVLNAEVREIVNQHNGVEQDHLLTFDEIKALNDLDGRIVANNAYYGLPDVSFTKDGKFSIGKTIDSTVLLIPRGVHSILSMAKNKIMGNQVYNTQAYELPFYSGSLKSPKKFWGKLFGKKVLEIKSDLPNKQRYSQAVLEDGTTESASTLIYEKTGLGKMEKDGLKIDGMKAYLKDHSRAMSVLKAMFDLGTLKESENDLKQLFYVVTNIDFQEIFGNLDPAIPDRDFDLIAKQKFELNSQGAALIRTYGGDIEQAWKAYCTGVQMMLGRVPTGADLQGEVELPQFLTVATKVDGAQSFYLVYKLLKELTKGESKPVQKKDPVDSSPDVSVDSPFCPSGDVVPDVPIHVTDLLTPGDASNVLDQLVPGGATDLLDGASGKGATDLMSILGGGQNVGGGSEAAAGGATNLVNVLNGG